MPPHFHVVYAGDDILVSIDRGNRRRNAIETTKNWF